MSKHNEYDIQPIMDEPSDKDIALADDYAEYCIAEQAKKPTMVFKYKGISSTEDLERVCDILQNHRLYMPTLNELNDPLESTNSIWLGEKSESPRQRLENVRVLSLTSQPLLSTMWAYYANNYQGICFGFKTNNCFADIRPVKYLDKRESIIWGVDWEDLYKKSEAWSHEAEYRIVYDNEKKYFSFDPEDLTCLIFGCKMGKSIQQCIESFVPKHIPLFTIQADVFQSCLFAQSLYGVDTQAYTTDELINIINHCIKSHPSSRF